jgi:hypothetical protein
LAPSDSNCQQLALESSVASARQGAYQQVFIEPKAALEVGM